jgi:hypothetical protein
MLVALSAPLAGVAIAALPLNTSHAVETMHLVVTAAVTIAASFAGAALATRLVWFRSRPTQPMARYRAPNARPRV